MPLKVITNFQEHQLESRNWARAEIYDFGVDLDYKNILEAGQRPNLQTGENALKVKYISYRKCSFLKI